RGRGFAPTATCPSRRTASGTARGRRSPSASPTHLRSPSAAGPPPTTGRTRRPAGPPRPGGPPPRPTSRRSPPPRRKAATASRRPPVVVHEHHQRVLLDPPLRQLGQELADVVVDVGDHAEELRLPPVLHLAGVPGLVLRLGVERGVRGVRGDVTVERPLPLHRL